MPWGEEYTGATLVDMYLAELAAHAWDLACATGQLNGLDPSLAVPALSGARAMIKPEYRDMVETGSPFGAEVQPPPGRRRLGTLRRLHGTRPEGIARPIADRRAGHKRAVLAGFWPDKADQHGSTMRTREHNSARPEDICPGG